MTAKDLLSQAEIDALLANVQAQASQPDPAGASAARSFDLASRRRLKKRRLPGLEQINKRFAEYFRDIKPHALTSAKGCWDGRV